MLARDLAREFPTVTLDTDALDAARMLAEQRLPGLIVLDETGQPYTVLPGSQVLRFVVPTYVQDDPALARAYDEKSADQLCAKLASRQVRDVLPKRSDVLRPADRAPGRHGHRGRCPDGRACAARSSPSSTARPCSARSR